MAWIRLDWIGMEWNGLDWNGLEWIGMKLLGWIETRSDLLDCVHVTPRGRSQGQNPEMAGTSGQFLDDDGVGKVALSFMGLVNHEEDDALRVNQSIWMGLELTRRTG